MQMFNPSHPGSILREFMGDSVTVTALAAHLGVSRVHLSNVLHGKRPVTAPVALRLAETFPQTDAELWMRLQVQYDLALERREKRRPLKPLSVAA
jgi:antitoxin HigA-1